MLREYKGYWISGTAGLVHAFSPDSYVAGAIYKQGRGSSIEEVTRFALQSFKMTDKDLAAFRARAGEDCSRCVFNPKSQVKVLDTGPLIKSDTPL